MQAERSNAVVELRTARRGGGSRPKQTRRTRAQWAELVEQQRTSGQSRTQFCRERGIALSSLDRWSRLLRCDTPAKPPAAGATPRHAGPATFLQIPLHATSKAVKARDVAGGAIEVTLDDGVQVRLTGAAASAVVQAIVSRIGAAR